MTFDWVLVAVVLSLGPYPVALRAYPDQAQCTEAAFLMGKVGDVTTDCVRVALPRSIRR